MLYIEFSFFEYMAAGPVFDTLMLALNTLAVSLDTQIASFIFIIIKKTVFNDSGW